MSVINELQVAKLKPERRLRGREAAAAGDLG